MNNERLIRILVIIIVSVLHIVVIFFVVINTQRLSQEEEEMASVMKLVDIEEYIPPPDPPPMLTPQTETYTYTIEGIAEVMIETDEIPDIENLPQGSPAGDTSGTGDDYLPQHLISVIPRFDEAALQRDIVYPPMAQRAGIEGRVILELFVDRFGVVQSVRIIQEEPEGRGFGEAAARAFTGRRGEPALANGEPVSVRYRYPVRFTLR